MKKHMTGSPDFPLRLSFLIFPPSKQLSFYSE